MNGVCYGSKTILSTRQFIFILFRKMAQPFAFVQTFRRACFISLTSSINRLQGKMMQGMHNVQPSAMSISLQNTFFEKMCSKSNHFSHRNQCEPYKIEQNANHRLYLRAFRHVMCLKIKIQHFSCTRYKQENE